MSTGITPIQGFAPLQTYKVLKPVPTEYNITMGFAPLQTYKVLKPVLACCAMAYWFCTITNLQGSQTLCGKVIVDSFVLHHYKLTRFSNCLGMIGKDPLVLHHYKLTRFSNYEGDYRRNTGRFAPLQTYKVLKPSIHLNKRVSCFAPLQTYKVLKLKYMYDQTNQSFAPLQTYKVLKRSSHDL